LSCGFTVNLELESNYFLIVVLAGALVVHPFTALDCVLRGRKKSCNGPGSSTTHATIVASLMAMIFYLVLRGGLISSQASSQALSPYGMAAIAVWSACSPIKLPQCLRRYFPISSLRQIPILQIPRHSIRKLTCTSPFVGFRNELARLSVANNEPGSGTPRKKS